MDLFSKVRFVVSSSPPVVRRWIALNIFSALALAVFEYMAALSIQLLLVGLGLLEPKDLPKWLPEIPLGLSTALFALVATALIRATFQTVNLQSNYEVRETFMRHLRNLFFKDVFYSKERRSKSIHSMQQYFGEIFPKAANWLFFWIAMCVSLVQATGIALFLLGISVPMTLVSVGLVGVLGIAIMLINKRIKTIGQEAPRAYERLVAISTRAIRGLIHIKLARRQEPELASLGKINDAYYRVNSQALLAAHISGGLPLALGGFLLAGIIAIGSGPLALEASATLAFVYLFVRFSQQMSQVALSWGQVSTYAPQAEICIDFLKTLPQTSSLPAHDTAPLANAPHIVVENISFRHDTAKNPILSHLSFEAQPSKITVLKGRSGSGKTTLSHLILGLYDPSEGRIVIDGLKPSVFIERHASEIAYVEALPFLFNGSLRDNMIWGLEKAPTDQRIEEVLTQVALGDFSLSLHIEENGQPLSTGQQQRLSIARALLRQPRLLIVDEPTSHLDTHTEALICDLLESLKKTVSILAISHQKKLNEIADQVIDLDPN